MSAAAGGEVEWYYAVAHSARFDSRHEAIGEAAVINRKRGPLRKDLPVWAYPECACEVSLVTLDAGRCCGRCRAVIGP